VSFLDLLRNAFFNLWRRKLRSFLTIFAVVIGASLVSLLVSLGIGAQQFITAQIKAMMPPDVVMVASSKKGFDIGLGGLGFGRSPQEVSDSEDSPSSSEPLTLQDIEAVRALEHVERIDPYVILRAEWVELQGSDKRLRTRLRAMPQYQLEETDLVAGRHLTEQSRQECIIANQYIDSFGLEKAEDALGQEVIVRVRQWTSFIGLPSETEDFNFEIVGVTEKTLSSTQIIISIEDGKEISRFWVDNPNWYTDDIPPAILQVKLEDSQYADQVAQAVEDLGLGAITSNDVLGLISTIFVIIQAVLSAFGLIALGVASLGIINTLIMAIYERTREIGVMKAVGASRGTIRLLFTAEGVIIGFLGGIIGVGIGYALGLAINRVSHATFLKDFQTFNISAFPWWLIVGVIALSTIIALAATLYPAHRASRLDPIEALRYE